MLLPLAGFGGDVDSALILEFIESGHDVVIAADPQLSEPVRYHRPTSPDYGIKFINCVFSCLPYTLQRNSTLCRELCESIGVDLEGKGTALVDHVDHVVSGGSGHTTVLAGGLTSSDAILGGFKSKVKRACRLLDGKAIFPSRVKTLIVRADVRMISCRLLSSIGVLLDLCHLTTPW